MHQRESVLMGLLAIAPGLALAAGTPAGTTIDTQVTVEYEVDSLPQSGVSNVVSITVAEVIDLNVLIQTPERLVSSGVTAQALYFTVTNTGNGQETIELSPVFAITGDNFDPLGAAVSVVLDSDTDGTVSVGDTNYVAGSNDPVLMPDQSVGAFLVADIPAALSDGMLGFAQLRANAATATGNVGDVFAAVGDAGVDVVIGPSGGVAAGQGEYLVGEISVALTKLAAVSAPDGSTDVVPGARLTYTIQVAALGTGGAGAALFRDPIPAYTQFISGSLSLNGQPLSDTADSDAGEYLDVPPQVIVRLGELRPEDPAQVVEFSVSINEQ